MVDRVLSVRSMVYWSREKWVYNFREKEYGCGGWVEKRECEKREIFRYRLPV